MMDGAFTNVDWLIVVAGLGSIYAACQRGLGKETLHTIVFMLALAGGYLYLRSQPLEASDSTAAARLLVNLGYYVLTAYVLTWAVLRFGSPLILDGQVPGLRSRFWAGALALAKLLATVLGLNLWYAIESPDAHPLRLQALPAVMRDAKLVQLSDATTDDLYRWMSAKGWLDYNKFVERPQTSGEKAKDAVEEMLGYTRDVSPGAR